ncbi:hypothetical protein [Scytonema sp. PCC 10023]|uniref:hypothetical protein n=1 Tax=Scytonema sp. PCC 10023 TaxID=1680591 RepID=UPI0039C6E6D4
MARSQPLYSGFQNYGGHCSPIYQMDTAWAFTGNAQRQMRGCRETMHANRLLSGNPPA